MHTGLPVPGEMVWIRRQRWRVEHARRDRSVVRLEVANRERRLTFLAPFDRPSIAQDGERLRYARPQSARAQLAYALSRAHGVRSVAAAVDARLTILAHQLEPTLALIHGARRVLVADEVGLGKTIQAGLAIAECVRRRTTARVLVLVPAALRDQWIEELDTRFALECLRADRHQLDALARSGARASNPWTRPGVWIASLDFLKQRHVVDALPFDPWDLVVVDEAHAACGDSERHAACDAMARRSRSVLMLTATPHDGDQDRFTRLLELGALPSPGDDVVIFRRTRASLNAGARRVVRWQTIAPSAGEHRLFRALQDFERVVLSAAHRDQREATVLLLSVLRKRALSTVSALVVSLQRRLAWLEGPARGDGHDWLQPRLGFDNADLTGAERLDEDDDADREALTRMIGLGAAQERAWLRRLLVLAETVRRRESKIERLARLLRRSREPAIVFTEFRHSLAAIASRLQHERPLAVLHGGQNSGERRRELQRFVDGRVSLLLATDVASLGLTSSIARVGSSTSSCRGIPRGSSNARAASIDWARRGRSTSACWSAATTRSRRSCAASRAGHSRRSDPSAVICWTECCLRRRPCVRPCSPEPRLMTSPRPHPTPSRCRSVVRGSEPDACWPAVSNDSGGSHAGGGRQHPRVVHVGRAGHASCRRSRATVLS